MQRDRVVPAPGGDFALAAALALALGGAASAETAQERQVDVESRTFGFSYKVTMEAVPEGTDTLRLWIPIPSSTPDQTVSRIGVMGLAVYEIKEEAEYGNRYLYTELLEPNPGGGYSFGYLCQVTRVEVVGPRIDGEDSSGPIPSRLLDPDRLVPDEGRPAEIARTVTASAASPSEKARALYGWILTGMREEDPAEWNGGKGDCADLTSPFIALCRASGIPALFEVGFSFPEGEAEGTISGYHCWAKFHEAGAGWTPVDLLEAERHPERTEACFGRLAPDRVMLSRGREIRLIPEPRSGPLPVFIEPLLEADGKRIETFQRETKFTEIDLLEER